jgi:hypothetical protein
MTQSVITGVVVSPTDSAVCYLHTTKSGERVMEVGESYLQLDPEKGPLDVQLTEQLQKVCVDTICMKGKLKNKSQ